MSSPDSDEARAARGDRAAFSALMASTMGDLHRFIRRYVGEDSEAHDLLQETYTAAWLAIGRYDATRPFETWLRTIAVNKCRDWARKRAVRRVISGITGLDGREVSDLPEPAPSGEVMIDDRRRLARVDRALAVMPDSLKAPLLLAVMEGRSQGEIAAILGVSVKTVETRIARARRKLAAAVGDRVD
ncbi:sigma-70 family RNA polymerase sigma factor [Brevundimonas sp.]|uniref:RNA polymerase sigma factor n=1 Tax=Brevundimonas sp. TaxID=1871086 RepID=UPI002586A62C|nr:sigma-70 family RNA polymerase sigma factor [Brevundimonas sp.]